MSILVSDLLKDSAALLNDYNQTLYTNTALLPFLRRALRELGRESQLYDLPLTDEVSANILVPAGTKILPTPADFLTPLTLEERSAGGQPNDWTPMEKKDEEPDVELGPALRYWAFREDEIKLTGANQDREVKLTYNKSLIIVNSPTATITIVDSEDFLMTRTAEHAARFLGENPSRADVLRSDADILLNKYSVIQNKTNQSRAVRRIPFGATLRQRR